MRFSEWWEDFYFVNKSESQDQRDRDRAYAKLGWNAALEEAAKAADRQGNSVRLKNSWSAKAIAKDIRSLKEE